MLRRNEEEVTIQRRESKATTLNSERDFEYDIVQHLVVPVVMKIYIAVNNLCDEQTRIPNFFSENFKNLEQIYLIYLLNSNHDCH